MPFVPRYPDLVTLLQRSLAAHGPRPLFGIKAHGAWTWMTYAEFGRQVERARAALASLGVGPGDAVALISNNRVEWAAAAFAAFGLKATIVPMYESQQAQEWVFIIKDSKAKVALVASPELVGHLAPSRGELPDLKHVLCFDDRESYPALLEKAAASPVPESAPGPAALASLIYTSGTTGVPKGVMLTHGNLAGNVSAGLEAFPVLVEDRSLSFLPWAHVFGQTCELYVLIAGGASIGLCEGIPKLIDNLAEVQPTVLMAVPNVFNRIYDGVQKRMADRPRAIRELFHRGLAAAGKRNRGEPLGKRERLVLLLAERLIFLQVRQRFGGKLRYAMSGGAALSKEVGQFIDALGISVFEGYGLTETSPAATVNTPTARRMGSVGKPLPGVRVVLDHQASGDPVEGEVVVYGHNVMRGYFGRKDETEKVFTADGGFRTGDLGRFDADGYLYITGRIKEQYKLENGKYVAPAALESKLTLSPYITQALVHGANQPFNVALIVLDVPAVRKWAEHHGIAAADEASLARHEKVRALIRGEIDTLLADAKGFEGIRDFALFTEEWSVANDLLTPKLSMKRRNLVAKYASEIAGLYTHSGATSRTAS